MCHMPTFDEMVRYLLGMVPDESQRRIVMMIDLRDVRVIETKGLNSAVGGTSPDA